MQINGDDYDSLRVLVAGVAHEMNTPLGVCLTLQSALSDNLQKLQECYQKGELCEEDIDEHLSSTNTFYNLLLKNINTAITLTAQLKKMSFIDSDWYECQAYQEISELIDAQRLTDGNKINYQLTGCLSQYPIYVPSETMSHIFSNLINNSINYGFDDGRAGKITIDVSDHQHYVLINYLDNGIGISESIRSRIFDPFFTTGRHKGGTGLGLAIIYTLICQRLNGSIELVDSSSGCNFLIKIPTTIDSEQTEADQ